MIFKLHTNFMKNIFSKLIERAIRKEIGIDMDFNIEDVELEKVGENVYFHVNVDGHFKAKDLMKVMKEN